MITLSIESPRRESTSTATAAGFRVMLRRNCSMSPRALLFAFALLAALSLAIASAFAALGAWLILPFAGDVPATDIAFPASLFIYSAASIFLEVVYRLFPIPLLLGLFSIFVRSARAREVFFWLLAILTSMIEPAAQSAGTQVLPIAAMSFVMAQQFGFNLLQAGLFRKYGYLASILARIAFYLPYHVLGSFLK